MPLQKETTKDFAGPEPYPNYILMMISKLAATSANPFPAITPMTVFISKNLRSQNWQPPSQITPYFPPKEFKYYHKKLIDY